MRKKEPWMKKGIRVRKSNLRGTIEVVNECKLDDGVYILNPVYVTLDGCDRASPFHPSDIDPLTPPGQPS